MIDVDLDQERLRIGFTSTEMLLGVGHDVDVPLSAVASVDRLRDPWSAVHGVRTGVGLRGVWLLGSWRGRGGRQLVALRRDQAAVRIRLRGCYYDELLVSTPHAEIVVCRLRTGGVRPGLVLASGPGPRASGHDVVPPAWTYSGAAGPRVLRRP